MDGGEARADGGFPLEQWYFEIPPISRLYGTLAVLTALACQFQFVTPLQLYFNQTMIVKERQYWRLLSNFFYFGPLGIDFAFYLFFMNLEEGSFRGRTADFVWMLVLGASVMIIMAPFIHLPFLGPALTFMMVYIWSRRNTDIRMNMLGLFDFNAPYLPWVLLGFSLMLSGSMPMADVVGIAVGHVYYFLEDVYPVTSGTGRRYLRAPSILQRLLDARQDINLPEQQQQQQQQEDERQHVD